MASSMERIDMSEFESAVHLHQTIKELREKYADSEGNLRTDADVDASELALAQKLLKYSEHGQLDEAWVVNPFEKEFLEKFAGKE